jgi:hypothetical protein
VDVVWIEKKLKMNCRRLLRDTGQGSRNTFTAGNGHHPGETPGRGNGQETGLSHGRLALAGGPQRRVGRVTGPPSVARPGKAPSISYMEGALFYSAG